VAPDGSIHVAIWNAQHEAAWEPGECCELQVLAVGSTDGGTSWSDPVHVVDLEDGDRDYPGCSVDGGIAFCRTTGSQLISAAFGFGNLAVSPIDGTLDLVFSDNRNGVHDMNRPVSNEDVFVMTSTDGGEDWTGPFLVSGSPGDEWDPHAAVNPVTGQLGVVYNDRTSTNAQVFNVTLATGHPGSFDEKKVTDRPSPLRGNLWFPAGVRGCMKCVTWTGEYIGLAYGSDGTAQMAWTDLRRPVTVPGVGGGFTENIFYARI
jgi:hypothetical protein